MEEEQGKAAAFRVIDLVHQLEFAEVGLSFSNILL
jgi:hypothetical protein